MAEPPRVTDDDGAEDADRIRRARLLLALRERGIADTRILAAFERVPRRLFVMAEDQARSAEDRPLAIECGQTITAPSVLAVMLRALDLRPEHRLLDVGTGSGYAAAVAAQLVGTVYSIDRYQTLVDLARERLSVLRIGNVLLGAEDGTRGWPPHAPYDRILVSAAAPEIPPALLDELVDGGVLVMPVGSPGEPQSLTKVVKGSQGTSVEALGRVRFVSLVEGRASML